MVHAGLHPRWTIEQAMSLAKEVEGVLAGPDYKTLLQELFHGPTRQWIRQPREWNARVSIARVFTRLRTISLTGEISSFPALRRTPRRVSCPGSAYPIVGATKGLSSQAIGRLSVCISN